MNTVTYNLTRIEVLTDMLLNYIPLRGSPKIELERKEAERIVSEIRTIINALDTYLNFR